MKLNFNIVLCLVILVFGFLSSSEAQNPSIDNMASADDYYDDYYDYYGCYGDYYYDSNASGPFEEPGAGPAMP